MKAVKITYYVSTGIISFMMLFSAYAYLAKPELKQAFEHLGFPDYFRIELAIAKLLAVIALWLPFRLAKEAAYIGLAITFVSAIVAHISVGDPFLPPAIALVILVVSFVAYLKTTTSNFNNQ